MREDEDLEDTAGTLPRRQLGRMLREARQATGMSIEHAARLMEWGTSTLSRLERGQTERIRIRDVLGLCELYGLDEEQTAVIQELAEQAPVRSWWRSYDDVMLAKFNVFVGLEAGASEVAIFQPLIVPGLLQTADYARILDRQYFPDDPEEEIDRRVEVRSQRQHRITRKRHPIRLSVVLHEAVLRTVVGSPAVMAAQLRFIADVSTRENVEVRILPFRAGFPVGRVISSFIVMSFPRNIRGGPVEPDIVYAESFTGDVYLERREDVRRCREAFSRLHAATLAARPSRDLLREIAREYDSDR
ncbi:helix-turn-helix domain-containing protein [Nocardia wallacei]|uniref:helix-turn-helix domain-containing protein n=1 Tax=Nocardia wallacei TaxID=480035 RepID=UPI0024584F15|nr:helix-turn-helix transcriptional regulator [Nocardia wallacei]